jgi:hypothetical protein
MARNRRHLDPGTPRAYVVPIVRELPRPIQATRDGTW